MRVAALVLIAAAGCTGGSGDDGGGPIAVQFTAPATGAAYLRDQLGATGALIAQVDAQLAIEGSPARVAIAIDGTDVVDTDATGHALVPVAGFGTVTLVATAYDATGAAAATDQIDVSVGDPDVTDCHAWLALYQVEYTNGPDNDGVADPVTATVPINGMSYRYVDNTGPRATMFADCELILSLARAAPIFRAHDITEIADYGIYNYRCIGTGTPPNCPQGMSQHAYAKAIDLAQFTVAAGDTMTVLDDWVIDPDEEATCDAATEPGADAWLHELICSLKAAGVWNIVLTPNYNADHRNHFHVDLTPDADFMRSRGRVDRGRDNH